MGKPRHRASSDDFVLRELAPQRFGFEDIETVECFYCGKKQLRIPIRLPDGTIREKGQRTVEGHHIYPLSKYPEMAHVPENYVFLCTDHHRELHKRFDRQPLKKEQRKCHEDTQFKVAGIVSLQRFLGLTARETVAYQLGWTKEERDYAHVEDGYFADQVIGSKD